MIRNGNRIAEARTLRADICIVGAGAAGISLAQALAGSRRRVIVLESGGLSPDADTQRLYAGEISGLPQPPLDASRLRYFGGTTNHWAGWCRPLDPGDFAERPWVPASGWPIDREDLDPYYERAHEVCDLGPWDYGTPAWGRFAEPLPKLSESGLRALLVQLSPPTRFGTKYGEVLSTAPNVEVLLESNLLELVPDENARTIRHAEVGTLSGRRFRVESRHFVLACGAVENARLLLSSNRITEPGLGNDNDLVGRYFMDHPRVRPAGRVFWNDDRAKKLEQYTRVDATRAMLAVGLEAEVQEREGLCNSMVFAEASAPLAAVAATHPGDAAIARFLQRTSGLAESAGVSEWWVRSEQSPNVDSRVTLGSERDALGMRRPVLDWRVQDLDLRTLARVSEIYAEALTRSGLARVKVDPRLLAAGSEASELLTSDWHQMGTTRMAETPKHGVVDSDCRVFGIDNLYLAGASVFPTSGAMNPTLTLVALALRLADHLSTRASEAASGSVGRVGPG
jgi:choline dehydrogenase-like flavoprotein